MENTILDELLERNRTWAQQQRDQDPHFFERHVAGQSPKVLWIGCSDSRVPAEQILGCGPGELFIHRNVANVVAYNDVNIGAVLQYGLDQLHIGDVIICGHYECGGVLAACGDALDYGYIGDWLMIIGFAKKLVQDRLAQEGRTVPPKEQLRLVVEENVRLQTRHLGRLSVIRKKWDKTPGVPRLHGWVYDIATGLINVVVDGRKSS
jgi:carbonic anhydrase